MEKEIFSHLCCAELLFSQGFKNELKDEIIPYNNNYLINENESCYICNIK